MREVDEPIEVRISNGTPTAFKWRNQVYEVRTLLDTWTSTESAWWTFARHEKRRYYRVHAGWDRHRVTAEIYWSERGKEEGRWILSALFR